MKWSWLTFTFLFITGNSSTKKTKKKKKNLSASDDRSGTKAPTGGAQEPDLSYLMKASDELARGADPVPFIEMFLESARGVVSEAGGYVEQARGVLADQLRARGQQSRVLNLFDNIIASEVFAVNNLFSFSRNNNYASRGSPCSRRISGVLRYISSATLMPPAPS